MDNVYYELLALCDNLVLDEHGHTALYYLLLEEEAE